jgi:cyanophycinase-like exopeptidase
MATSPNFTATPKIAWSGNLTTGTNNYDGTSGTTVVFTAGSSGSFLRSLELEAAGTNVATVLRVFINNGSAVGTASNNALVMQYSLPATTASATVGTPHVTVPLNLAVPAGYVVRVVLATTVAAGWQISSVHGDY